MSDSPGGDSFSFSLARRFRYIYIYDDLDKSAALAPVCSPPVYYIYICTYNYIKLYTSRWRYDKKVKAGDWPVSASSVGDVTSVTLRESAENSIQNIREDRWFRPSRRSSLYMREFFVIGYNIRSWDCHDNNQIVTRVEGCDLRI